MTKNYIGIDNGVTGAIGLVKEGFRAWLRKMPVKNEQSYTKARQKISRVDFNALSDILFALASDTGSKTPDVIVLIERPMVNPGRFKATASALRCLEATLIAVESMRLPYQYIDSKQWQRAMLPKGITKEGLKQASLDIGKRLFPTVDFKGFKDADALLMAEWARREGL